MNGGGVKERLHLVYTLSMQALRGGTANRVRERPGKGSPRYGQKIAHVDPQTAA